MAKKPEPNPPRPIYSLARVALALPLPRDAGSPLPPRPPELTIPAGASTLSDETVSALSELARTDLDALILAQVIQFREPPESVQSIVDRRIADYFDAEQAAIDEQQKAVDARRAELDADRSAPRDKVTVVAPSPHLLAELIVHVGEHGPVSVSTGFGRTVALERGTNVLQVSALAGLPETALRTLATCTIRPRREADAQATTPAASRLRTHETRVML